jgi:uncharacterized protein (DUF1330 family)
MSCSSFGACGRRKGEYTAVPTPEDPQITRFVGPVRAAISGFSPIRTVRRFPMKYYAIAEIQATERDWISAYIQNVSKLIQQFGGRYLARTPQVEKIEGERATPQFMVIVEWPSKESALAFYHSAEYSPYLKSRLEGAKNDFILVAGEDVTGATQVP